MKTTKPYITAFLSAFLILCLAGCGGGSDTPTTTSTPAATEKINGITVPVEPDPVKNTATIAGIDSNSNGVRDDAERMIASKSPTTVSFDTNLAIAKKYQNILTNSSMTKENVSTEYKNLTCLVLKSKNISLNNLEIAKLIVDTNGRKEEYRKKTISASGFTIDTENDCN